MTDGRYSLVDAQIARKPPSQLPKSEPPPAGIVFQGRGWKVNVPLVLATAVLSTLGSALAARQPSQDITARLDRIESKQDQLAQDLAREVQAVRDRQMTDSNAWSNRQVVTDAALRQQEIRIGQIEARVERR